MLCTLEVTSLFSNPLNKVEYVLMYISTLREGRGLPNKVMW